MKKKLFRVMLLLVVLSTLLTSILVLPRLCTSMRQRAFDELRNVSAAIVCALDAGPETEAMLARIYTSMPHLRISLIDLQGAVLYDSGISDITQLEDHSRREEVIAAFEHGEGQACRLSASLGENTYYYARRIPGGAVLRIAVAQRSIFAEVAELLPSLFLIAALVIGLLVLLSGRLSVRLLRPINTLNLDRPEGNEVYEELSPLLSRLSQQNRRIEEQITEHFESAQKGTAITENMAEGLMMLSPEGKIVSMNQSAMLILESEPHRHEGQHYMSLYRNLTMHGAIEQALSGDSAQVDLSLRGSVYRLHANPVWAEDALIGVAVLLLDITASVKAETNRREFSANVSHELKSPLTIIAGYAEMMKAGMAEAEDNQAMASQIYDEAGHLLSLIDDIIALSHLDENAKQVQKEPVDLYALAEEIVSRFHSIAKERGIDLALNGEHAFVEGILPLLEEMLWNLVDNAIRYNRPNGSVTVCVRQVEGSVVLMVQDTGIGISASQHDRIFERFYRVDKSRSRKTGGTGLGLSIVKHCAQIHLAEISVKSEPEKGTCITVLFGKAEPKI